MVGHGAESPEGGGEVKGALAESDFDLHTTAAETSDRLHAAFGRLLHAAQRAGTVRVDVDVDDVKAVLAGALVAQQHIGFRPDRVARVREIALGDLRCRMP